MHRSVYLVLLALSATSCGGGGGGSPPPAAPAPTYSIGGTVTGLDGTGLVLENNGSDPLTITADGTFAFAANLASGASYNVTVRTQPTAVPARICSVSQGVGAVAAGSVTSVVVSCRAMTGRYVYTANSSGHSISAFSIDPESGALTEIVGSPFAVSGDAPRLSVLDPTGSYLYVIGGTATAGDAGTLTGYAIDDATGALTEIPGMPIAYPAVAFAMTIDPSGRYLYLSVNSYAPLAPSVDNGLHAYAIDAPTGSLTPLGPPYRFADDTLPATPALDSTGAWLLVPNGIAGDVTRVTSFAVDPNTGALIHASELPVHAFGNDLIAHPSNNVAYLRLSDGSVSVLAFDPTTGELSQSQNVVLGFGFGIATANGGEYLYVVLNGTNPAPPGGVLPGPGSIASFGVDPTTGELTALPGSPYATGGNTADGLVLDPTGRYLAATNTGSGNIGQFSIDTGSGQLSLVDGAAVTPAVGTQPGAIAFDPSGRFAYLTDAETDSISSYSIDPTTGTLNFLGSQPTGSGPTAVAQVTGLQ